MPVDHATDRMQNLRDVGGLPLEGGGAVARGVLLRGDAPRAGDVAPELAWPPRTVLDLRSGSELTDPHPLSADATVVSFPLSAEASVEHLLEASSSLPDGLEQLYEAMLAQRGEAIAQAAALVAEAPGPVLVHCTAGKDRTGTLVAVLLLAAGVEEEAIVADYLATGPHMDGVLARIGADPAAAHGAGEIGRLLRERPDLVAVSESAIRAVLARIGAAGGAGPWLVAHGLGQTQLDVLRRRLRA